MWSSCCGSVITNPTSIHEDMSLIPSPTQWVKDLVLPWAVVYVTDTVQILHCCGYGIGWQLQLWFTPSLGTSICCRCSPKKAKSKKKDIESFHHSPNPCSIKIIFLLWEIGGQDRALSIFFFFFCLFKATLASYGSSQARGQIRAVATGLHHSYSNTRSKPCLWPIPQLTAMLYP